jgi:indolepyruvate ferredoxin oxidoreductase
MRDVTPDLSTLTRVSLDDKYELGRSRIFVTGSQAVVRLAMMQRARDAEAGLNTAGYVTGYRGSPLGVLDLTLSRAERFLKAHNVLFQPGLNEDLAAAALWGAQTAQLRGEGRYDGVFGIWYGKGPGVDRSGDAFRHANHAGAARHGGVLALMGDDHTCESSTSAHQSEFAFVDAMIPVLNPAGVQEILDYGLLGFALSRFAGVWVGLKCVKDNIEQTAVIEAGPDRARPVLPAAFALPEGGLNIRLHDAPLAKEARLHDWKRLAILAFVQANRLDRTVWSGGAAPRMGIVTTGKSYLDVAEAFDLLGVDEARAAALGLRLHKVAATWPLDPEGVKRFASGLDLIIVVEEKRSLIETQIKEQLYGTANAPVVVGKRDERGEWLFPAKGALEPVEIAIALGRRVAARHPAPDIEARLAELERAAKAARDCQTLIERIPYFCAGCPHNTSTRIPEGARAYAGIGCHYMVQWMDRATEGFTQMGGEGANWIGEAPFSTRRHVFQNMGDGTYLHSGSLAIRAAVAAGVNVTFKLLYNDAVAMTGGQPLEGHPSVQRIAREIAAEGVRRIVVVTDEPEKYGWRRYFGAAGFPRGAAIRHRDELDAVQRELQEIEGVTVLIYDQTCAAEKRRRRRRGLYPDPAKRVIINELLCEGCGDCGVQSNCVAITPVETEYGRKRAIDQSACNKDFSCLKGFCPSLVTVYGGRLRRGAGARADAAAVGAATLPAPRLPDLERPYSLVLTGVGGTGVVTLGALIGMAAHIEGKGAAVIDMSGLAQKGGAVTVHVRVARRPEDIKAIRASAAGADSVIGGDLVVTASARTLGVIRKGRTLVTASSHEIMTASFTHDPDLKLPAMALKKSLTGRAGEGAVTFIDAQRYATLLAGDAIAANMLLLGCACQLGRLPVSPEAIEQAIELNGVQVEMNRAAFAWGRRLAHDPAAVETVARAAGPELEGEHMSQTLDEAIERRVERLAAYQDAAYAARYRAQVERMRAVERRIFPGREESPESLTWIAARSLFKLMAYKDEYETARLFTDKSFVRLLERTFEGDYRLEFNLAPPLISWMEPATGRPRKRRFGGWMMGAFRLLARMKGLRGSWLDPFGWQRERRLERALIAEYEGVLDEIVRRLHGGVYDIAAQLAATPEQIRGFGFIKMEAADKVRARQAELFAALGAPAPEARRSAAE